MPTIAELQINLDSRPISEGTRELNNFANAAERAAKASKVNSQANNESSGSSARAAQGEANLSAAIDAQTRKLEALAQQRQRLDQTSMKSTMPAEYERLNRIIDANIALVMRQGNAVDSLNAKQDRDTAKRERAAATELRIQERIVEATIRQENVVTRAAARQQREIDATINGLSRQIAAQNEYNRTLEVLNRARATSGLGGPTDNGVSGAEYESYVKLAQARRDAALGTEDNTRAITAAQNKLDTYTATLGRVERAEVEYSRAVGVLNQAQQLGLVTIDQYDAKLAAFTARRDSSVKAANDNSAAEQRFARELQSVISAYDPVLRAQNQYNASVKILSEGLQTGAVSVEQFNKSLTQQREALEGVKSAQSGVGNLGSEYDAALNRLVPYRAELRNLEQQEKVLKAQRDAGQVTTTAQIRDYDQATRAIARQRAELEKRTRSGNAASLSYKQEQAALRGIPAQITDIVVSLQGGQAPLTVLLQQGGQIKDMFGGILPAITGLTRGLMAMINPLTVAVAAAAALGAAAYSGSNELTAFNRAVIQSGNASGVSGSQFAQFRDTLDETTTTAGKAAAALTMIEASGKIAGDQFVAVAEAAILFERATGQALDKTIEDFTSLGKDPVDAAVRLDEKYKFLTASILAQADALVRQGNDTQAIVLLQTELASTATDTANRMVEEAGYIERAWLGVRNIVSETWDALKNIGRASSTADTLRDLQESQRLIELSVRGSRNVITAGTEQQLANNRIYQQNRQAIIQLEQRIQYENLLAKNNSDDEKRRSAAVIAQANALRRQESSLKGVEKAENELLKVRRENEKIIAGAGPEGITAEQRALITRNEARAVEELAEAREKANKPKRSGALDTTNIQEVRSDLKIIEAEYEGYYKRVTALGEANIVSDEATYQSQRAILEAQRKAVSSSYDAQIAQIEKLRDGKKNSAAQNISLDNQLTKAEADRVASLEKLDAKLDTLQTKEQGRIETRTRNIASYKAALDAQLESLQADGARNADGVGRGSRAAGVARQLGENDRSFNRQQRQLANSQAEGMDPVEYAAKLKDLQDAHTAMTEQILKNDRDIDRANMNWTNGFTAAVEDARDAGLDFAGSVEQALSGAFNSAGNALATFVTTGKINFKSFTLSILADLAQIAARQAASGALSALLSFGASAAGAYFGGGANGFAAGSAGAQSSSLGASQAGYSSQYFQAQGGAWSGGTQMFAQGGAFTNQIVSSPTSFGMANGSRGIMGEAGEEAIIPLARTRNGDLGVRLAGGMGGEGGGGPVTIVNVNVQVDGGGSNSQTDGGPRYDQFGNDLGNFVRQEVYSIINSETRPGGTLQPAR